MKKNKLLDSVGMSLIEVLVASSIAIVIAGTISSIIVSMIRQQSIINLKSTAEQLRQAMTSMIQDDTAWGMTMAGAANAGASFACLRNGTNCAALRNTSTPFTPYDALGNLYLGTYNARVATHGFNPNGAACTQFSAAGNLACPMRYAFTWRPLCPPAGACINPQILIQATFSYSVPANSNEAPLNTARYSFTLYRGYSDESSIINLCRIINGTYVPATKNCISPTEAFNCPGGLAVVGFANGRPQCANVGGRPICCRNVAADPSCFKNCDVTSVCNYCP